MATDGCSREASPSTTTADAQNVYALCHGCHQELDAGIDLVARRICGFAYAEHCKYANDGDPHRVFGEITTGTNSTRAHFNSCDSVEYAAHRLPQPNTAPDGNGSPAPSGFGKNRSGLNTSGSWKVRSSQAMHLAMQ